MEPQEILSMGASSQNISTPDKAKVDTSLLKVLISYPEGYDKRRFHEDGKVYEVSAESANAMIEKGIATMVDEDDEEVTETELLPDDKIGPLHSVVSDKAISTIVDDSKKEPLGSAAESANAMIEKGIATMVDEDDEEVTETELLPDDKIGPLHSVVSDKAISTIVDDSKKEPLGSAAESANAMIEKGYTDKIISTTPVAVPNQEKKTAESKPNSNKKSTSKK